MFSLFHSPCQGASHFSKGSWEAAGRVRATEEEGGGADGAGAGRFAAGLAPAGTSRRGALSAEAACPPVPAGGAVPSAALWGVAPRERRRTRSSLSASRYLNPAFSQGRTMTLMPFMTKSCASSPGFSRRPGAWAYPATVPHAPGHQPHRRGWNRAQSHPVSCCR